MDQQQQEQQQRFKKFMDAMNNPDLRSNLAFYIIHLEDAGTKAQSDEQLFREKCQYAVCTVRTGLSFTRSNISSAELMTLVLICCLKLINNGFKLMHARVFSQLIWIAKTLSTGSRKKRKYTIDNKTLTFCRNRLRTYQSLREKAKHCQTGLEKCDKRLTQTMNDYKEIETKMVKIAEEKHARSSVFLDLSEKLNEIEERMSSCVYFSNILYR